MKRTTIQENSSSAIKENPFSLSANPEQRFKVKEVADLFGIGVSTVWKMVADGRLPAPERYGSRCSRWRYGNLQEVSGLQGDCHDSEN